MANDLSLQASDIHVIPPVNGQDNVQDALENGGGGSGGFPVGPLDDATNTYEISAGTSNTLLVSNMLDGSNAGAIASLEVLDADTVTVLFSVGNGAGDKSGSVEVDAGSFALNADDGTNTYEINADSGNTTVESGHTASGAYTDIQVAAGDGTAVAILETNDGSAASALLQIGSAGASNLALTLDTVVTLVSTPTTLVLAPATIPTSDPHVVGQVFSSGYVAGVTPGTLMISAG